MHFGRVDERLRSQKRMKVLGFGCLVARTKGGCLLDNKRTDGRLEDLIYLSLPLIWVRKDYLEAS